MVLTDFESILKDDFTQTKKDFRFELIFYSVQKILVSNCVINAIFEIIDGLHAKVYTFVRWDDDLIMTYFNFLESYTQKIGEK